MSDRVRIQIEQIESSLAAMRANLPKVSKLAEESENELVRESLQILKVCLGSLDTALSDGRLSALPISPVSQIAKVAKLVADVTTNAGGDFAGHAGDLTNQVDALHNRLWIDRLIDPGAEVAAHQSAVGQLQASMSTVRELIEELREGLRDRETLAEAVESAEKLGGQARDAAAAAEGERDNIRKLAAEAQTVRTTSDERTNEIGKLLEQSKESRAAVTALEADLRKWHTEMGAERKALEEVHDSAETRLDTHDAAIAERNAVLDGFDKRIREQFALASSGALAESFGRRGKTLFWGKVGWGVVAFSSYAFFVGFAIWAMRASVPAMLGEEAGAPSVTEEGNVDWWLFLVRMSVSVPIGLLVWFVTIQYGKARRVQESYAFKGVVASSFDAYRDLVEKVATDPALKADPEYAKFIRETIERIYAPPPMGKEEDDNPPHTRVVKDLPGVLKGMAELAERLKRL